MNSLSNIISGVSDTFGFICNYFDNTIQQSISVTKQIKIPQGYYTVTQLQQYLCENMTFMSDPDQYGNTYLESLGNNTVNSTTQDFQYPGVSYDPISTKFLLQQFPDLLTTVLPGYRTVKDLTHQYTSFQILYSTDTERLMMMMGSILNSIKPTFPSVANSTIYCTIQSVVYDSTTDSTTFTYGCNVVQTGENNSAIVGATPPQAASIYSPYIYDMNPNKSLYIEIDGLGFDTRAPWGGTSAPIVYRVPMSAPYQVIQDYSPPIPYSSFLGSNAGVSSLTIRILNERQEFVDFQGTTWQLGLLFSFLQKEPDQGPIGSGAAPPTKRMKLQ